jgi:prepilin-type N-terminal cleavage/methylation domain-containing protein
VTRPRTPADAGFTMLEVMVSIGIAGTLMAIAVTGWQSWSRASAQDGFVTEIQLVLRQAQQRAVTTGTSVCVDFDASTESWTVKSGRCDGTTTTIEATRKAPKGLDLVSPVFDYGDSAPDRTGVTFRPWGSATPGGFFVEREGGPRVRVAVAGLTGRVSTS